MPALAEIMDLGVRSIFARVLASMVAERTSSERSKINGRPSGSKDGLDEMMWRMGIEDEEYNDVVFEKMEDLANEGIKWPALARVHTANEFAPPTFYSHMRTAWGMAQEVKFRALEKNHFTI